MEQNIIARWRPEMESFYKGVDAQKCANEIESIGTAPTYKEIVDKARDENTELHKNFEWRDNVAAENWRVQQARTLCSNLLILRPEQKEDDPPVRYFYKASDGKGVQKTTLIYRDLNEYKSLVERAKAELRAWEKRYAGIKDIPDIFEMFREIFDALEGLME